MGSKTKLVLGVLVVLAVVLVYGLISDRPPDRRARFGRGAVEGEVVGVKEVDPEERLTAKVQWPKDDANGEGEVSTSGDEADATEDDDAETGDDANGEGEDDETTRGVDGAAVLHRVATLQGMVTFRGEVPEPEVLDMSSNPKCKKIGKDHQERPVVHRPAGLGVADAVVWIENIGEHYPVDEAVVPFVIEHCRFPTVAVARVGQSMEFVNADPVLHHVHAEFLFKRSGTTYTFALSTEGDTRSEELNHAKTNVPVTSKVHPWMKSRLYVFDHPFYAVTDAKGRFEIGVPGNGPYRVVVEHPYLGRIERTGIVDHLRDFRFPQPATARAKTD
ncbi:MAG: hypothetical protein RIT81_07295 [Deltaproteobacteria bacterium]